jgi:hypothetical protein
MKKEAVVNMAVNMEDDRWKTPDASWPQRKASVFPKHGMGRR